MLIYWEPRIIPTCAHNNTYTDKCKVVNKSHTNSDTGIPDILVSQLMVRAAISIKIAYTSTPAEPMAVVISNLK